MTFLANGGLLMLGRFFKREDNQDSNEAPLDLTNIPSHIAIIMDGNGRWAKRRGLPRIAGQREGTKVIKKIVQKANEIGVSILTLSLASIGTHYRYKVEVMKITENWKRPKDEVDFILKLPESFLDTYLPELIEENVQVRIMGEKSTLPAHTIRAVDTAIEKTKQNNGLILNFALNYGSRYEISKAIQHIAQDVKTGSLSVENINDELISSYLFRPELKDPDLLIRTSGEIRLSNFMLWQLAYTELWFTDTYWPDFTEDELVKAVKDYQMRGRRFGGVQSG